jgi:hypothetical protein
MTDWLDHANCIGHTPVKFPGRGHATRPAKRICAHCPLWVRQQCADTEIIDAQRYIYGVRAGMTVDERRNRRTGDPVPDPVIIRDLPQRAPAPCGSRRAAQRHRDNDEELCPLCRNAEDRAAWQSSERKRQKRQLERTVA